MKAVVYNGPLDVRVEEVPEPDPLVQDEVLLAAFVGSLCRTDVTEFVTGPKMIPLHKAHPVSEHHGPVVSVYEFVGLIQAIGAAVTGLRIGQGVPSAWMWCGTCPHCRSVAPISASAICTMTSTCRGPL